VCRVKSAGDTESRSDQATGKDTGAPGRTRGLYAATTVAPPERVESRNTFPSRSSLMYAVVARSGSMRSARAAIALVAAATSSAPCPSIGTNTWTPLAPLVFTAPDRPASASACRIRNAAPTASSKASGDGGSRSSTRCVG
jgi:hypothetical protein